METHAYSSQDREKNLKLIYNFIKEHKLGIIATVDDKSLPEAAVIGIAVTKDLEIICGSFNTSRKYENLKKNPRVALVIGWEKGQTVQYEGITRELDEQETETALETFLENIPSAAKYVQREYEVVYKIKPTWIRFSDLSTDPWERFEVRF